VSEDGRNRSVLLAGLWYWCYFTAWTKRRVAESHTNEGFPRRGHVTFILSFVSECYFYLTGKLNSETSDLPL